MDPASQSGISDGDVVVVGNPRPRRASRVIELGAALVVLSQLGPAGARGAGGRRRAAGHGHRDLAPGQLRRRAHDHARRAVQRADGVRPPHRQHRLPAKIGVWDRVFEAISRAYDGDLQMIDSSSIRVHQHGANGKKGGPKKRHPLLGTSLEPAAWGAREAD